MPFLGPIEREIAAAIECSPTHLQLTYQDGTTERITKKLYAAAVAEEPVDWTTLRQRRVWPIVEDILKVLLDWDVKLAEVQYCLGEVASQMNQKIETASDKLWGMKTGERSMTDLDHVLTKNEPPDKNKPH